MLALLAAIAFSPPGPVQHATFADAMVRADISYRISHDRQYDTGEAAAAPSISSGTISIAVGSRRIVMPIGDLWPIQTNHIVISATPSRDGCGTGATLSHHRDYLIVEGILAQKGCQGLISFIDLRTGRPVENVLLDHAWDHRFDAVRDHGRGETFRVLRVDLVGAPTIRFFSDGRTSVPATDAFMIVHAADEHHRPHEFSFCECSVYAAFPGSSRPPTIGSSVTVSTFADDAWNVVRMFEGQRVLTLSASDEARFDAAQTPTPRDDERLSRHNEWFTQGDRDAEAGHFFALLSDYQKMVAYDDNSTYRPGEARTLLACRQLLPAIRRHELSQAQASRLFLDTGCVRSGTTTPSGR